MCPAKQRELIEVVKYLSYELEAMSQQHQLINLHYGSLLIEAGTTILGTRPQV